jgi:4-carboxymuconolactone decarboxylase
MQSVPRETSALGGRLPLLRREDLSTDQASLYDLIMKQFVPALNAGNLQSNTSDGRLIGPFNPLLYSPEMSSAFLAFQLAEAKSTSLEPRVRQVVILAVGAVWKTPYEIYAHAAVARKVGFSEEEISELSAGGSPKSLSGAERVAQQYATQLTTSHLIDDDLFAVAKKTFGPKGLVDMAQLIGAYPLVCAILNSFAIPAP